MILNMLPKVSFLRNEKQVKYMTVPSAPRVKTGIPGLDPLISGGVLHKSINLVTGETGTGKTIFSCQYLWHGLQKGETCVYITLEEDPEDIKEDALQFGWDFQKYIDKDLCRIIYHDPAQVNNLSSILIDEIKSMKAKRLVIDPTSVMGLTVKDPAMIRKMLLNLINVIKRTECTAILTSEVTEDSKGLSRFGVEEFVADAVFILNYIGLGESSARSLIVRKMRRTNHGKDIYPLEITSNGLEIKSENSMTTVMR
jgi:circadian clock protein KaiC